MKGPIQKVRGAILVMTALILVLLIGVAGFALDLGRLFVLHTEMQNAVDAAVLSAAAELDGEDGAIERAKEAANQDILNHLSHFSKQGKLLEGVEGEAHTVDTDDMLFFTFYSWIGSSADGLTPPSGCTPVDGRCLATSYDDASYVQIKLDPVYFADPEGECNADCRYEIDLYFLPVLSLFVIDTAATASTRVVALAGSHYKVCNFPPMIVCYPNELNPGEMVVLKTHTGGPWSGGEFGWTVPSAVNVELDPVDISGFNEGSRLAHRLGSIYGQDCSYPIVEPKSGNLGNSEIRQGLNTRFGMYEGQFSDYEYEDLKSLPSAPNVIDYPRDDDLTIIKSGECKFDENAPNPSDGDWDVTECHSVNDLIVITANLIVAGVKYRIVTAGTTEFTLIGADDNEPDTTFTATGVGTGTGTAFAMNQQPSTYSKTGFDDIFHEGETVPTDMIRADYYIWEVGTPPLLDNPAVNPPLLDNPAVNTLAVDDFHNSESQCVIDKKKYVGINGNKNNCRMLNSAPFDEDTNVNEVWVDTKDEYKRRELFVAVVNDCATLSEKEVNVPQAGGKWAKFFLTEHVDRPGAGEGLNVFAEFMGYVVQTDDEHFKKVIQLYE